MSDSDHRPRVAAERRERMRQRLVDSAMLVFAEKGVDASLIDDVIAAAQVSRGSFYNHFKTNAELLGAVGEALGNETMRAIEITVEKIPDPAVRIATGLRLYLETARGFPHFARFIASAGLNAASPNNLVYEFLPPHISAAIEGGRFEAMSIEAAIDLIAGTMLVAVFRVAGGQCDPTYFEEVVASILRGLGMSRSAAAKMAALPVTLQALPADSLLMRTHGRGSAAVQSS